MGHIRGQGRAADMDQVGLGSFAGAAGDNTRLALEVRSADCVRAQDKRREEGRTNPEEGNTVLDLGGREADLLRSSPC